MKFRAVLVENEEGSLGRLRRLLSGFPEDVEIIGEAMDGPSAVEKIRVLGPDLVFLDIDLPGFNGFQVLERLDRQPAVIFTTAFNQHALEAFKTYAVDYLLKPLDKDVIGRALEKLRVMGFNQAQFSRALERLLDSAGSRYLVRIRCKTGDRTVLVKTGEVLYFKSEDKYITVQTVTGYHLTEMTLAELLERLDPRDFIRIHRSYIVNVPWIAEIRRAFDGKLNLVLRDPKGTVLPVSRTYSDNLKNL
jgi:two-component system, LytTR family, response regulator